MGSRTARRIQLIFFGVIGASALLAAILAATGSLTSDGISLTALVAFVSGGGISGGVATKQSAAAPPGRVADSVDAFTKAHGAPPDATYGRIRIPAIAVNAPLTYRLVPDDPGAAMPDPSGPTDVAYYDMSKWPGLGGVPGAGHNAIFGGHVDLNRTIPYAGGAQYIGPAVFWSLDKLRAGDGIEITVAGGTTLKYSVVSVKQLSSSATADWSSVWNGNVKTDTVTLFTCGGNFDSKSHEYTSRTIVRAERVA
jgi:LPXTG-site transpeptidase (sortase) family protein